MVYRKKLIEVALPLDAINKASTREKSIRHSHPSTLHLWWARRPLAACRAVLFASLVDDPSEHLDEFPTEQAQEQECDRLFRLLEALVQWENSNNKNLLQQARAEILKSTGGNPPPVLDPFAGGGSIPLEAQRLGLETHASDLNPVAVLINKALIEFPPKFANRPPVNPEAKQSLMERDWHGAPPHTVPPGTGTGQPQGRLGRVGWALAVALHAGCGTRRGPCLYRERPHKERHIVAQSNHERVGRALEILNTGLTPFIEREMLAKHGERWRYEAARSLREQHLSSD